MQKKLHFGDGEIVYEEFGQRHDPTVLLVAGAGAPGVFWHKAFMNRLDDAGFHVVRYCHRDTGASTHFDEKYPIDDLLADLFALMAETGAGKKHLVGHSMGGFLAQMAMCENPVSVASVTSISAGPAISEELKSKFAMTSPAEETWAVLMENTPVGDFERDLAGWLKSWKFLNGRRPFDLKMATEYTRSLYVGDERNAKVAENHIHAMSTIPSSLVSKLATVKTPFLAIHGSDDPLVPIDNGMASARCVPGADFQTLDGAGHMFFHQEIWAELANMVSRHCRHAGTA